MASLKEEAMAYQPKITKNIADISEFSNEMEVYNGEGKDKDQKPFKYKYILIDEEEYRIPESVFAEIKEILKIKPNTTRFRAVKSGTGLATRYKVVGLN